MVLETTQLPKEYGRDFVPEQVDLGDWEQVESLFEELEERDVDSVKDLEKWLRDRSELVSAIYEENSVRYIRMTSQTDDEEYEEAYLEFVEEIEPKAKKWDQRLKEKYLELDVRGQLPQERYGVIDRRMENDVELFRDENVPLEVEETKLGQRYQKVTGAMTVEYDGEEQTLQQMGRYLEKTDRDARREAWELIVDRRLEDKETINEIYDELRELRDEIARNAGFDDYRDYAFRKLERFEYTPEDCFAFHDAVEEYVVPLNRELQEKRMENLDLDVLRPWDLDVDPKGRPPLSPFDDAEELVGGLRSTFRRVDGELAGYFDRIADLDLLDLESRKGKAPGGYQATLAERRLPFIFMNAVGRDGDVRTMLHEAGHAFHTFLTRDEPLVEYRHAPIEFAEVASMTMDLIGGERLDAFYESEEKERSQRRQLEEVVGLMPWIATIDSFQHWVYTNPDHGVSEREEHWLQLKERFGGIESWDGHEEALRNEWQKQRHLFLHPFYYIEYGIAQLGAMGIWVRWRQDPESAVESYKTALSKGGGAPLPELFEAAGLDFDFGAKTVRPIVSELRSALQAEG